jgi:hypothetical protein
MRKALPIAAAGVSPDTQLASGRHQADHPAEPGHDSEETTMRPAFLCPGGPKVPAGRRIASRRLASRRLASRRILPVEEGKEAAG